LPRKRQSRHAAPSRGGPDPSLRAGDGILLKILESPPDLQTHRLPSPGSPATRFGRRSGRREHASLHRTAACAAMFLRTPAAQRPCIRSYPFLSASSASALSRLRRQRPV
jgi:hypothetical protein